MKDRHRCLMLGAGAMGSRWIRDVWQPFRDRMEFAGLVDPNPAALVEAGDWLGLPPAARFTDAREAFATVDANFCCIVTPPAHHREAVELACDRGMDILSEKPIADTPEACGAIARAVKAAGVRMMVTQNYRYTRRILTLKEALTELGAVNFAVARYASSIRAAETGPRQCRYLEKSGSDNPGIVALSGTKNIPCQAQKREKWFL